MTDEPVPAPGASVLDIDRIPPDPAALITSLAQALALVHVGASARSAPVEVDRHLDHAAAVSGVVAAIEAGWTPPEGSPYERVGAAALGAIVAAGSGDVQRRAALADDATATVGEATLANLVLPVPPAGSELSGAANLTFRRPSSRSAERPGFASWERGARCDPYRDLAVAMADVVATFGPGAVLGFVQAYVAANPEVEPIDPIRLDWWSTVTAVIGSDLPVAPGSTGRPSERAADPPTDPAPDPT